MLSRVEAREAVLSMITATVPRGIWQGLPGGAAWAYGEAHNSTRNDPRVLTAQARFRAAQDRHFFMETALARVAEENGAWFEPEAVRANEWRYGVLRAGCITLMQKKVDDGREPPPAAFRRQVASANAFVRQADLFYVGEPHSLGGEPIHGIIIHAPESQRFADEGFGKPAFVRLAVPFGDYSGWVLAVDVNEVLARYPDEVRSVRPAPAPVWKTLPARKDEQGGG